MEKITLRQTVLWILGLFIGWRWIVIYSVWSNLTHERTILKLVDQLSEMDGLIFSVSFISVGTLGACIVGLIFYTIYHAITPGNDIILYRKPPNPDKIHEQAGKLLMNGKTKEADELLDSLKKERQKLKIKK